MPNMNNLSDNQKLDICKRAESEFFNNVGDCRKKFKSRTEYIFARFKQLTGQSLSDKSPPVSTGAKPVSQIAFGSCEDQPTMQGGAIAGFNAAVEKRMAMPGFRGSRRDAIARVMKDDPALHRDYLEQLNPGRNAREAIADRFDSYAT